MVYQRGEPKVSLEQQIARYGAFLNGIATEGRHKGQAIPKAGHKAELANRP